MIPLEPPPNKRIRIDDGVLASKHHILSQPGEHFQIVISFLNIYDLASLTCVNRLLQEHITKSEMYIKEILIKYCKLPLMKTESMYRVRVCNRNMATILYDSYLHYISDNLNDLKRNTCAGIDNNFELIDKKDIIPLNIYDLSQKHYFDQLCIIFDQLGIWNHMVSVIYNPLHFNQLCLFNDTNLFKAYSRLLSYNLISMFPEQLRSTHTYALLNIHRKMDQIVARKLNYYELRLFKPFNAAAVSEIKEIKQNTSPLIVNHQTFMRRMNQQFAYCKWKHFVDWNQFWLIGGSVLKCVLKDNWSECGIDLDLFAHNISYNEYIAEIKEFVERCERNGYNVLFERNNNNKQSVHNVYVNFHRINNEKWQKFQFVWYDSMGKSELLNVVDIDCTQIGFDGHSIRCTFACVQSITTKTIISYKLVENCKDSQKYLDRILKYQERGFQLVVPYSFRDRVLVETIKYYKENTKKMMDSDKDRKYEHFMLNNDTMRVRSKFIQICETLKLA